MNSLELINVSKNFKGFQLDNIGFTLPKGYIMGLVGPNGAGKTTTIQLILNMLEQDTGEIFIFGKDNSDNALKQDIGVVFDSMFFVDRWTVKDTENAVRIFYDDWNHDVFSEMTERFELPLDKKISKFSRGMQMKLMISCALSHNAKLLILDEPTSGLDPVVRDEFLEILQEFIKDGERSVLFSTHIIEDLARTADYITLLNKGALSFTGSVEELINTYRMIKGKPGELTPALEQSIIGLRKTDVGFEGLLKGAEAERYNGYVLDTPTINDIVVGISKGAVKK